MPCGASGATRQRCNEETIWELAERSPAVAEASVRRQSGRCLDGDMRGSRRGTIPQSATTNLGMAGFRAGDQLSWAIGAGGSRCPSRCPRFRRIIMPRLSGNVMLTTLGEY